MLTFEYSPELRDKVDYAFKKSALVTEYPKLKLQKLIYLLEDTEYYFESYCKWVNKTNLEEQANKSTCSCPVDSIYSPKHANTTNTSNATPHVCLASQDLEGLFMFILGSFYLYLIIPQSIQFQTRNKSFSIYTELKKLYYDEFSMFNVTKMVIDYINENDLKKQTTLAQESKITRPRAYSVSTRKRSNTVTGGFDKASTEEQQVSSRLRQYSFNAEGLRSEYNAAGNIAPGNMHDNNRHIGSTDSYGVDSEEENEDDDDTIAWSAPRTSSKDQLSHLINSTPPSTANNKPSLPSKTTKGQKASFMWEDYKDEYDYENVQDDLLIQLLKIKNLAKLSSESLFNLINNESDTLLLIDLRFQKRFYANHIVTKHLINIDPHWFTIKDTNTQIDTESGFLEMLHDKLDPSSLELFKQRKKFKHIVYYTDMKSFLNIDFDYCLKLFQFLYMSSSKNTPTSLIGGLEEWKKFLKQQSNLNQGFPHDLYLYKKGHANTDTVAPKLPTAPPPSLPSEFREAKILPPLPVVPPPSLPITSKPSMVSVIVPQVSASTSNFKDNNATLQRVKKELTKAQTFPDHYHYEPSLLPSTSPSQQHAQGHVNHSFPGRANFHKVEESRIGNRTQHNHPVDNELAKNLHNQLKFNPKKIYHYHMPTIEDDPNEFVSLSITGLKNVGNTCYINAMIQCLFEARIFRNLFLSSKFKEYFSTDYKGKYQISTSFYALFRKMYMNGGCSVVPSGFLKSCNLIRPDFNIPSSQQDSQEFLLFLLDQLHTELSNRATVLRDLSHMLLHDDKELEVNEKEYDSWFEKNIELNGVSPVDEIFQGQIENCLECQNCGHSTYNYSTFYVLSLAIPAREKLSRLHYYNSKKKKKSIRLEDCINLFTGDELLSHENAWDCPKCSVSSNSRASGSGRSLRSRFFKSSKSSKSSNLLEKSEPPTNSIDNGEPSPEEPTKEKKKHKKVSTMKTMNFISLPHILVIQLSRFYYDLTKKNETVITYPLFLNIELKNNTVVKYRLYGLVNHFGDLSSGHYTALVNKSLQHSIHHNSQKWYYFDDETVKIDGNHGDFDNGFSSISSSDAYVLFYEKMTD